MGRSLHIILRFMVGVIAIIALMNFLGVSLTDVTNFVQLGLKSFFEVFSTFQGALKTNSALYLP